MKWKKVIGVILIVAGLFGFLKGYALFSVLNQLNWFWQLVTFPATMLGKLLGVGLMVVNGINLISGILLLRAK